MNIGDNMPLLIKNSRQIYFTHIPKTGGVSIYENLAKQNVQIKYLVYTDKQMKQYDLSKHKVNSQHFDAIQCAETFDFWNNVPKFTIIRNPWGRTISEYRYSKKQRNDFSGLDDWILKKINQYKKNEFIDDNHIKPQINFITPDTDIFTLDNFEKVEKYLSEHFLQTIRISKIFNASKKLGNLDSDVVPKNVISYRTHEIWENFYSKDIEMYNHMKTSNKLRYKR